MTKKNVAKTTTAKKKTGQPSTAKQTPVRAGRPIKEPPPEKLWRIEGLSPDGMKVTLGRYLTEEETEPELTRLREDAFYKKLHTIKDAPRREKTT